jgi:hypothetical protein
MLGIARGARGANAKSLRFPIDPDRCEQGRASADPALEKLGDQIVDKVGNDLRDAFRRSDRLEKVSCHDRSLCWHDRDDRLSHKTTRLIQTLDCPQPEPAGERTARHGIEIGDALQTEPGRRGQCVWIKPKRCKWQIGQCLRLLASGKQSHVLAAKPRQRIRSARRASDGDACRKAKALEERQ